MNYSFLLLCKSYVQRNKWDVVFYGKGTDLKNIFLVKENYRWYSFTKENPFKYRFLKMQFISYYFMALGMR